MQNKLIFNKPNIWYILTISSCVFLLLIFLFGFSFGVFKVSQTTQINVYVMIFWAVSSILILLTLFWIFKKFSNKDYLELNLDKIIARIDGKDNFIPYEKIAKIDFNVQRAVGKNSANSYTLKIITLDQTFLVSNILANFWNFKKLHLEMANFVQQNKIGINITKNFDYQIITIKNYIAKIILVIVWLYVIGYSFFYIFKYLIK